MTFSRLLVASIRQKEKDKDNEASNTKAYEALENAHINLMKYFPIYPPLI